MLFNTVFNEIVASRKPLILHNGFLDMMHVKFKLFRYIIDSCKHYPKLGLTTNQKFITHFLIFTTINICLQIRQL
jgi:hypothetical protein